MERDNTTGVHVWLILWKAGRAVEAHAHASIGALGICYSDFAVLEALLHKGSLPVNQIGRKVLLTSGSITAAVDRLEQRGLVERGSDSSDRRARIVHLTSEGKKLITSAFADHEAALERAAVALDAKERATLLRLLKKLGKTAAALMAEATQPPSSNHPGERKRRQQPSFGNASTTKPQSGER